MKLILGIFVYCHKERGIVMKKISYLLCLVIFMCFMNVNVSAAQSVHEGNQFVAKVQEQLNVIQPMKKEYGFSEEEDFTSLSMGRAIPTMEYVDGELIKTKWELYSIVNEAEQLIALALKSGTAGEMICTISTEFIDDISSLYNASVPFSIVYDATKAYAVYDEQVLELSEYPAVNSRDSITSLSRVEELVKSAPAEMVVNDVVENHPLKISDNVEPFIQMRSANGNTILATSTSKYLNVRKELQFVGGTYYPICWACSDTNGTATISGALKFTCAYNGSELTNVGGVALNVTL